jgi:hypothetical protein
MPLLEYLAGNGVKEFDWYLRTKIVEVSDCETQRDHERVLKYAYNFCLNGGVVSLIRESSSQGVRTPDMCVEVMSHEFFLEVKKFRMVSHSGSHPAAKIVAAIEEGRAQLPSGKLGLVAIDNFSLGVEEHLSHEHIVEALCEVRRMAAENPAGWQKPSGAFFAACTSGGVVSLVEGLPPPPMFPHFIWANEHSVPSLPTDVVEWLAAALPDGTVFDSNAMGRDEGPGKEGNPP